MNAIPPLEDHAPFAAAAGRLSSPEAEVALIGAAIQQPGVIAKTGFVRPGDFAEPFYGEVWRVLRELGASASLPTALARLEGRFETRTAAADFLRACVDAGSMASLATEYADLVKDFAHRRAVVGWAEEALALAADTDRQGEEVLAELQGKLQAIGAGDERKGLSRRAVLESLVEGLGRDLPCYPTGLADLDTAIGGGLFSGKLYGIAARKKVGKTVLLGTISHNLNLAGVPHLFVAGEMSPEEVEMRNVARELRINSVAFLKRDQANLQARVADYATRAPGNVVYEHAPGLTLDGLRSMVARHRIGRGIKGVVLDYWQLVGGKAPAESEEYHLRRVAQWLADVARREGLFVLVAAQVNQEGNTRGGEGLKLAADLYLTLHREKDEEGAWLEMEESRYTMYADIGSKDAPGLRLNSRGPFFEDATR